MSGPWLHVLGFGEDGIAGLSGAARAVIEAAEVVIGGTRHFALAGDIPAETRVWPSPFDDARPLLQSLRGRRVAVLASGDPMWFGAGATLARWFPPEELAVIPHPGAFSLAAARLIWPVQDCLCLSVHGRPLEALALHFHPGRRLLILAGDRGSAGAIARLLDTHGCGASRMVALHHLGGALEGRHSATAAAWSEDVPDLAVIAVEIQCSRRALPLVPGLPDEAFDHDGQVTKREIRAVTLAALAPMPGAMLWDVGAGSGSVAIEWMRAGGQAVAIEPRSDRRARIAANALRLGVPGLEILAGRAPDALPTAAPDAVFIGGGVSASGVLDACWSALGVGGRLVANAVTAEGEAALLAFRQRWGGEMVRLAVSRLAPTGGFSTWHAAMPVTQFVGTKG